MRISVTLTKPYSARTAAEATGFTLDIGSTVDDPVTARVQIPMADAIELLREMATLAVEYREAVDERVDTASILEQAHAAAMRDENTT